jgi:hypothetical protein
VLFLAMNETILPLTPVTVPESIICLAKTRVGIKSAIASSGKNILNLLLIYLLYNWPLWLNENAFSLSRADQLLIYKKQTPSLSI